MLNRNEHINACHIVICMCIASASISSNALTALAGTCYTSTCLLGYVCYQDRFCGGPAVRGTCDANGFFCSSWDCEGTPDDPDPNNACNWAFRDQCVGEEPYSDLYCVEISQDYLSSDCAPSCDLVFYNQCTCSCEDSETGVEAGCADFCSYYVYDVCNLGD